MFQRRFTSFLVICCLWLSAVGLAASPAFAQPAGFDKISPGNTSLVSTSTVNLTWGASTTPGVQYEYCMFSKQNCPPGQWKNIGANTSVSVTVKPGSTYFWQVRARDIDNSLTYANDGATWTFTTGSAAPSAFTKSSPANGAQNQPLDVIVSWTASSGLNVSYQVCYLATAITTCDGKWLPAGTATSYIIQGLDYATTYYWQVRAFNSKGTVYADGAATSFRSFTTRIAAPAQFGKLTPENGATNTPNNITLIWSPSSPAGLTYEYCLVAGTLTGTDCAASGGTWKSTGSNTFVAPAGLTYGETYYWQVRARNNATPVDITYANGGAWWSFIVRPANIDTFTKLIPGDGATDVNLMPILYWSSMEGAGITYEYCLVESGQDCNNWASAGGSTFAQVITELKNNTAYTWQVQAKQGGTVIGTADDSTAYNFTTLPAKPEWNVETFSTPEDPAAPYAADLNVKTPSPKTLVYLQDGQPSSGTLNMLPDGSFTFTPAPNFSGSVTFRFTIWDGVNPAAGPYTATITVTPVNDPPVITPIADVSVFTGSDIFFAMEASDPDLIYGSDILTAQLIGAVPAGATYSDPPLIDATGAPSIEFEWLGAVWKSAHPQPYAFTFTVTDGEVTTQDSFTITIVPNVVLLPIVVR